PACIFRELELLDCCGSDLGLERFAASRTRISRWPALSLWDHYAVAGRPCANRASSRSRGDTHITSANGPLARGSAVVHLCDCLYGGDQTHCGPAAPYRDPRVAEVRSNSLVHH